MISDIEQLFRQAVEAHKKGALQDAEKKYTKILESVPSHSDANHNLGVLALAFNQSDRALRLFKIALNNNPKVEQFWLSYLSALIKGQHLKIAKLSYSGFL